MEFKADGSSIMALRIKAYIRLLFMLAFIYMYVLFMFSVASYHKHVHQVPPKNMLTIRQTKTYATDGSMCENKFKATVCDVKISTPSGSPDHPGYLSINNIVVYQVWTPDAPFTYIFTLSTNCSLLSVLRSQDSQQLMKLGNDVPAGTFFAGITFGSGANTHEFLMNVGVMLALRTAHVTGTVVYIAHKGYLGHTMAMTPTAGAGDSLERHIHFGTPFDITNEKGHRDLLALSDAHTVSRKAWTPRHCVSNWRLALIVPLRNRPGQVDIFVEYISKFLKLQRTLFTIIIVEQTGSELFNRAALLNAGYLYATSNTDADCFIFHDVDSFPENLANTYACSEQPRHLMVTRAKSFYRLRTDPYEFFGGAIALTATQMDSVNGFPNKYFGWGKEDDEILERFKNHNFTVLRYPPEIGSYSNLEHERDYTNPRVNRDLESVKMAARASDADGLSTIDYVLEGVDLMPLYTKLRVRIPGPTNIQQAELLGEKYGLYREDGELPVYINTVNDDVIPFIPESLL